MKAPWGWGATSTRRMREDECCSGCGRKQLPNAGSSAETDQRDYVSACVMPDGSILCPGCARTGCLGALGAADEHTDQLSLGSLL